MTLAAGLGLGYYVLENDAATPPLRGLARTALGWSAATVTLVVIGAALVSGTGSLEAGSVLVVLGTLARALVQVALLLTVAALGGAALARTDTTERSPERPTPASDATPESR